MLEIERKEIYYQLQNEDFGTDFANKCIETNRDINVDYDWWDFVYENFYSILEILGYYDYEAYFSGFWSQGDGASFKANWSYKKGSIAKIKEYAPNDKLLSSIVNNLQEIAKKNRYDIRSKIGKSGNYEHEMTMYIEYYESDVVLEPYGEDDFLEVSRKLAVWLYKKLEEAYDYLTEDEIIFETLVNNEYQFDKNGKIKN